MSAIIIRYYAQSAFNKAIVFGWKGCVSAPNDRSAHIVFRWLIGSPIFSLRSIRHASGRCESPGRSGAGGNSEGEHPGAQRCRSSNTTTAHGRRQHREGFPGGQCPIHSFSVWSTGDRTKLSFNAVMFNTFGCHGQSDFWSALAVERKRWNY